MFVKICCISTIDEARLAIAAGAHAVGLVSRMPSGPGTIDEDTIAGIAAAVPPPIASFLLTCETEADAIVAQHRRCRTSVIQLVDRVTPDVRRELRDALPGVSIVQVVHVVGPSSVEEAMQAAEHADALLLDSGDPSLPVKTLGGTGRVHNWSLSRRIRAQSPIPVFLAGGLHAGNVAAAIEQVEPWGIDVCSGVRRNDRLDAATLARLLAAVRGAAPIDQTSETS
ncbi:MAG: phosphoribosylanthranilate isomerase [Planctomycetota bacterium]